MTPAARLGRAPAMTPAGLMQFQSTVGNQAVADMLQAAPARSAVRPPAPSVGRLSVQRDPPTTTETSPTTTTPTARAAGPDEVVLSVDPAYAKTNYVGWFLTQVKGKVESWGLSVATGAVSLETLLISGTGKPAMVLKWDSAWGAVPTETVGFDMAPVDARACVTAVHALGAWAKVPGTDQPPLDALLGAQTNQLSKKARERLRGQFVDLKTKPEGDQAAALTGLLSDKLAAPDVSNETVTTAKTAFAVTGPTALKDYAFRGRTADAEQWAAAYTDGITLTIIAPKAPEAGFHNHTVQQTADAAAYLPKAARSVITKVVLNVVVNPEDASWAVKYSRPDFHSYMTAGAAGELTIYPDAVAKPLPSENSQRTSMLHETGHTWSYKKWGTDKTKGKWIAWKAAMGKDRVAVSSYARADIAEDIAETFKVYLGTKGSAKHAEYRSMVPNRFAMLDTEYT